MGDRISLPRVTNRGLPPQMKITKEILKKSGLENDGDSGFPKAILYELYFRQRYSQGQLAKLFNVQRQTVARWLKRLDIATYNRSDVVSHRLMKHDRNKFSNSLTEKSYLIGLRTGDLTVQKHGRGWRISVTTTHPAMEKLIRDMFSRYGCVRKYRKKNIKSGFEWSVYCDLNNSFEFLISKPSRVPEYIANNQKLFFAFLAGYFDADGCININYIPKESKGLHWMINSCDKRRLMSIAKILRSMGYVVNLRLIKKADGKTYNKDYWCLQTSKKDQVLKLLKAMPIRHPEKQLKRDLAFSLEKSSWVNASKKIFMLRSKIKNDVLKYGEKAAL